MKKIVNLINLIIITQILLSTTGCHKNIDNGTYTIKGHLYTDCSKTPIANKPLTLELKYYNNNYPVYVDLCKVTTDTSGYFEFKYSSPAGGQLYIETSAGFGFYTYLDQIPQSKNIDSINIYERPSCSIITSLNVINPYTSNDTLYLNAFDGKYKNYKIAGHFVSGQILPLCTYNISSVTYNNTSVTGVTYKIGYNNNWQTIDTSVMPCNQYNLNIDIK